MALFRLILLLALAGAPLAMASDHPAQKCDGTTTTTGTTGGTSCAAGVSQAQASSLAYVGFPSVPKCSRCTEPSGPCFGDLGYETANYTESCFVAAGGVWVCCATMPAGTKWDMKCGCQ